jgi:hypothetical protein
MPQGVQVSQATIDRINKLIRSTELSNREISDAVGISFGAFKNLIKAGKVLKRSQEEQVAT